MQQWVVTSLSWLVNRLGVKSSVEGQNKWFAVILLLIFFHVIWHEIQMYMLMESWESTSQSVVQTGTKHFKTPSRYFLFLKASAQFVCKRIVDRRSYLQKWSWHSPKLMKGCVNSSMLEGGKDGVKNMVAVFTCVTISLLQPVSVPILPAIVFSKRCNFWVKPFNAWQDNIFKLALLTFSEGSFRALRSSSSSSSIFSGLLDVFFPFESPLPSEFC